MVIFLLLLLLYVDKIKIVMIKKFKIFFINEFFLNIYKIFISILIFMDNFSDKVI